MTRRSQYGLIGKSLIHSASPELFRTVLRPQQTPIPYACFPLQKISQLTTLLREQPQIRGLNVTIPYKREVLKFVDNVDSIVRTIGATNTLYIDRRNGLSAFNTDVVGARSDLEALLGKARPQSVLILGTGGAAEAVSFTLTQFFGQPDIRFASRNPASGSHISYDEANAQLHTFSLIINATPVGMYPNIDTAPALNYAAITDRHVVWDLIYNPRRTRFLEHCAAQGASTRNGWGMLVEQARASLNIWEKPLDVSQLEPNPWQEAHVELSS
ncbi:MAG: shikimate dehydrogenase family protein [Bacteroidota bacterium]